MPDKSWNHRITKLRAELRERTCSAPGCKQKEVFLIEAETDAGCRRLRYCRKHAWRYAKDHDVTMPLRDVEEAWKIDLRGYTDEALADLAGRIRSELARRENENRTRRVFIFDVSGGVARQRSAYAARLYLGKGNKIQRNFFTFQRENKGYETERVFGEYSAHDGDVIEKRFINASGELVSGWYIIYEGKEVFVSWKDGSAAASVCLSKIQNFFSGKLTIRDLLDSSS